MVVFFVSIWLSHRVPKYLAKHYLWVSVRMFSNEISIWIGELSKAGCSLQCGWASSDRLRAWIEQKAEEGRVHSFSARLQELEHWSPALGLGFTPSTSLVPRPADLTASLLSCVSWSVGLLNFHLKTRMRQFLKTNPLPCNKIIHHHQKFF